MMSIIISHPWIAWRLRESRINPTSEAECLSHNIKGSLSATVL